MGAIHAMQSKLIMQLNFLGKTLFCTGTCSVKIGLREVILFQILIFG
jgi:hypothetical protein